MTGTVNVSHVSKSYRLYRTPGERVREALHPLRRRRHHLFYALNDVSLRVTAGETLGIIGRNGSGKSTLLKIIAGIITPCRGTVSVQGRVSALLELGAGFNPELSGRDNIYFSGIITGRRRGDMHARLPQIAAFADIGPHLDQPVKTYSSGMFVRLAFAVAVNVDPDILIVDEALAVGDINFQARCFRRLAELRRAGCTVIFVSHALDSILRYCDKVLVLDRGCLAAEADPKTAVDVYKRLMAENDNRRAGHAPASVAAPGARRLDAGLVRNPDLLVYGSGQAEITDCGLQDEAGRTTQLLHAGEFFTIRMEITFRVDLANPVFAYTIKDLKGVELTGANTLFQCIDTGRHAAGRRVQVEFRQRMTLRSGRYALSLGCTGLQGDTLVVYQRLYDVVLFEVTADKPLVGLFDPYSEISLYPGD